MRSSQRSAGVVLLTAAAFSAALAAQSEPRPDARGETTAGASALPDSIRNFRLDDHLGRSHELRRYRDAKAIVLVAAGNGCPIWRRSIPGIKQLRDTYAPQGVVFLMINGNPFDKRSDIAAEAAEFEVDIPILIDDTQLVTADLAIRRISEAFLINPQDRRILYRGAIDDRFDYGASKQTPEHSWLKDALDAYLSGGEIQVRSTDPAGCLVEFLPPPNDISYAKDVAPVIQKKCQTCHLDNGPAPFDFYGYESVRNRTRMIREVVMTKRMPPWSAAPTIGRFANDCSMTPEETRTLIAWIDSGAARGKGSDPLESVKSAKTAGEWALGKPDLVVQIPEPRQLPAEGVFDYEYFQVPSGLEEDVWVTSAEVLPTNNRLMHHVLVFLVYPPHLQHLQEDMEGGLKGFFAGYVPGQAPEPFPKNTAKWVPAGSVFVFQNHYNATGKPETAQPQMGLRFTKKPPKEILHTRAASTRRFEIPPGAADITTQATHRIRENARLWALSPHMHYRGSWFEYTAEFPDGRVETLLSVPRYDFDWQHLYRLEKPIDLPAGTRIVCRGGFDNSARNPDNPAPDKWVYFGEQSFDEMFIGYLEYSVAYSDPLASAGSGAQ